MTSREGVRGTLPRALLLAIAALFSMPGLISAADEVVGPVAEKRVRPNAMEIATKAFDNYLLRLDLIQRLPPQDNPREHLIHLGQARVAQIDRWCALSDDQKQKLNLASRRDVHRLFDQVDAARIKFAQDYVKDQRVRIGWDLDLLRFQVRFGLFRRASLFHKTLFSTLSAEQLAKFQKNDRQERQALHHAQVVAVVSRLEAAAPLQDEQRTRLTEFLEKKTSAPGIESPIGDHLMFYELTQLPAEQLKAFFTPDQWNAWSPKVKQRSWMKPPLERAGLLPVELEENAPGIESK